MIDGMNESTLELALSLVHRFTGITMLAKKQRLLEGRLRVRMKELGLASYGEYLAYLQKESKESQHFVDVVTTNESTFFRTEHVWEFFENEFLVDWTNKNPKQELKIWSGAASSGEEIHTIAICCEEYKRRTPSFRYCIDATDISNQILDKAKSGRYPERRRLKSFASHRPDLFARYVSDMDGVYVLDASLRKHVNFSVHNLFTPPPRRDHYDIVFLRNVLFYFTNPDQKIVLGKVSTSLKDECVLVVGESESLMRLDVGFDFCSPQIYRKKSLK